MTDPAFLNSLITWARMRDDLRALILTSTRATSDAAIDAWSDYDLIAIVRDIGPWYTDRAWLDTFGDVLIAYWDPLETDPLSGSPRSGNVVQFADGLKTDWTLVTPAWLEAIVAADSPDPELDAGYRVLVDKDDLTTSRAVAGISRRRRIGRPS